MKYLLMFIVGLLPSLANADVGSTWLTIPVTSYHFKRTYDWNENNLGIGASVSVTEDDSVSLYLTTFRNSYNRRTFATGVQWMPFTLRNESPKIALGGAVGLATGYAMPVTAYLTMDVEYKYAGFTLIAAPAANNDSSTSSASIGLQLKVKFP